MIEANSNLGTPILFMVFNRPEQAMKVFDKIRLVKPIKLFVASDGPRDHVIGESDIVSSLRNSILSNIDWECEVETLFRENNLGCKWAVSGAISWFFSKVDKGIILEDDCVPDLTFFPYCEELLLAYEEREDVYMISGDSRGLKALQSNVQIAFCKYPMIWGWATWARVWKNYDVNMSDWPLRKHEVINRFTRSSTRKFWVKAFDAVYYEGYDTWDYQFCYLFLLNGGKCIVPNKNLVSNIGFGKGATHTRDQRSPNANRILESMSFPIVFCESSELEEKLNDYYDVTEFSYNSIYRRMYMVLIRLLKK